MDQRRKGFKMFQCKTHHFVIISILVLVNLNFSTTIAKTLASDSYYSQQSSQSVGTSHQQQQPHQHNLPVNYAQYQQQQQPNPYHQSPSYPEYDENMESYEYPSSEEIMPVKNSQFVPVEDDNATTLEGGHIPQRQVSISHLWKNMQEQQNNQPNTQFQGVTDQGSIEVVSIPGSSNYNQTSNDANYAGGGSLSQYYQQQSHGHIYQPQEIEPSTQTTSPPISITSTDSSPVVVPVRKKSDVSKLVVETRRTAEGKKIAVVRDRMRAARQRRSIMTLSREDENDSEYDDLESGEKAKNKNTQVINNSTVKATVKS